MTDEPTPPSIPAPQSAPADPGAATTESQTPSLPDPQLVRRRGDVFLIDRDGERWQVRDCQWRDWAPQFTPLMSGLATYRLFTHANGTQRIFRFADGAPRSLSSMGASDQLRQSDWLSAHQQFDATHGAV